jgi:hypothetical protein
MYRALVRIQSRPGPAQQRAELLGSVRPLPDPWPVVKRLGEQAIHELLLDRHSGTKQSGLALRYY